MKKNRNDNHVLYQFEVILCDKDAFSSFKRKKQQKTKKVPWLECVLPMSATNNTFSLFDIKLNIITACCSGETEEDLANISQCSLSATTTTWQWNTDY